MKAVIKREFFSAFHRLTAYIAVAVQLFLSAVVISSNNLSYTLESTATAVSFMSLLSLIVIPVIAGEFIPFGKRAEADDVYGALPLAPRQIALGKFFAAMSVVLIADAFLIFAPFLAGFFGTVDHLMSYTAMLGLLLLQAVAVAFCLLVFRAVKNRILAYVTVYASVLVLMAVSVFIIYFPVSTKASSAGFSGLCLLIGVCVWLFTKRLWFSWGLAVALRTVTAVAYAVFPWRFAGLFATVITGASPIDRFNRFLSGVLDFGSVLYFASLIFFLLWCLCRSFALPHEAMKKRPSFGGTPPRPYTMAVLLLAAAVLTVNVATVVVPSRMLWADATVTKKATPSEEALRFISGVEKDVDFYILEPIDATLDNTMNYSSYLLYLERLVAANPRFSLAAVYGEVSPEFYSERGLSQGDVTPNSLIIQCGDRWQYLSYYNLLCFGNSDFSSSYMSMSEYEYWVTMIYKMYQSSSDYAQYWYSINYNTTTYRYTDTAIATLVEYVTKDIIPTAYYLTGHGEADINATSVFYSMGLTPLDTTASDIPRDAAGIVVNRPATDFSEEERDAFLEYLSGGGQMTFLTNEENLDMPNLCAVLSAYGMSAADKALVTRLQEVGEEEEETQEPTTDISVTVNFNNDVLGAVDSSSTSEITLSKVNAIKVNTDGLEYPTVIPLIESPSDCYIGEDTESRAGYILGCAVETPNGARVVWFTGGESLGSTSTGAEAIVTGAVAWTTLKYETQTGRITPTLYKQPSAIISSGGAAAVSVLLYLTAVGVLVFGVVTLYRRKKQ